MNAKMSTEFQEFIPFIVILEYGQLNVLLTNISAKSIYNITKVNRAL